MSGLQIFIVKIALVVFLGQSGHGYGSGAPSSACSELVPRHGVDAQRNKPSPVAVFAERTHFDDGSFRVTLNVTSPSEHFVGYIVQARLASDTSKGLAGEFRSDTISKTVNCDGPNTLTHRDRKKKTSVSALWTPPKLSRNEAIVFQATVVKTKFEFWVELYSEAVLVTSKSNAESDERNYNTFDSSLQESRQTANLGSGFPYSSCSSQYCFGIPSGCVDSKNCAVLMTAVTSSSLVNFALYTKSQNGNYAAVGLSDTGKMSPATVTYCVQDGSGVSVKTGVNSESNSIPDKTPQQIFQTSTKTENGITSCSWSRSTSSTANKYILVVSGPWANGDPEYHGANKGSTSSVANFQSFGAAASTATKSRSLIKAHGVLMIISWVGFVSIGIMVARHFKQVLAKETFDGKQTWFSIHRILMCTTVVCHIAAVICIFVFVGGWSGNFAHPILGILTACFMVTQVTSALLRCHPGDANRWIFNWLHWASGNIAHILAIATIFTATLLKSITLPTAFLVVMIAYVVVHVIIHIVMQIFTNSSHANKTGDIAMNDMNRNNPETKEESKDKRKSILLGAYVVLVLAFAIALAVMVGNTD